MSRIFKYYVALLTTQKQILKDLGSLDVIVVIEVKLKIKESEDIKMYGIKVMKPINQYNLLENNFLIFKSWRRFNFS